MGALPCSAEVSGTHRSGKELNEKAKMTGLVASHSGDCTDQAAKPPTTRRATRTWLGLSAAMVVAFLLRMHCLIYPYLWLDEYVTLWSIGGATYAEMLDRTLHWTANGPLFVLCYRAFGDLVSNVELGLKLPGVLFGTMSVLVAWWAARQYSNAMTRP